MVDSGPVPPIRPSVLATDDTELKHDSYCCVLVLRVGSPMSYSGFGTPISHLSNQPTMCCNRSTRCNGCPERDNSCVSFGKRTITVGILRYFSARNIASPPEPVGVR